VFIRGQILAFAMHSRMTALTRIRFSLFALVATLVAVTAHGCGTRIRAVPVSGRVTIAGKPLADVAVNFSPMTGGEANAFAAYGKTDQEGRFTLKLAENDQAGATAGMNRVTFNESSGAAESDGAVPMMSLKLPPKARDGTMTYEVPAAGTTEANFDF
jgi:hypothetical protein